MPKTNRIEPADDANGEPDAAVDGSNAADPVQQAHVDTGSNSQGQGEQTQEGYITIVDGQEEVVEEEEPHKADYGGGSGGDSWVDQDDALLAQPSVQQHQQKHQGQQQQQQYPQHGAASSLEAAAPTMPRQQQALASANARQKPEAYTESRTRPPTAIPKPKHSRPSLVTPGQNSSAVRGSSRHTGLIQSILMKHRKSQSDADVLLQFPWAAPLHETVGDPTRLLNRAKVYWRKQFEMFKLQMEDIQGTEFYCPLGYLLNLHTTERMSTFLEKLRCFFARLRSFDQIDGRIDPVKGEDSLRDEGGSWFSCFQKEPDAVETEYDKIWPPSPEELLELFYPADAVEQQKATVIGGPRVTLVGSKAAYNEAISMIGEFDPRMLQDMWSEIRSMLFESWAVTVNKTAVSPVHGLEEYVSQVAKFARDCYHPQKPPFRQKLKPLEGHVAMLCSIFNFGGCVRLSVSAEQPQITRELLLLHKCFKMLASLYHEGDDRRLLLGPVDHPSATLPSIVHKQPPAVQDMFISNTFGARQRIKCENCTDPEAGKRASGQGDHHREPCQCCSGTRVTDNVAAGGGLDWEFKNKPGKEKDYIYYDKYWGWEWPRHPVHARSTSGRNAIFCAVQAGDMGCVELLLAENADLLAVTYGGDTLLHYAARFDNDQILFRIILALVQPSRLELGRHKDPNNPEMWAKNAPEWLKDAPANKEVLFPTPLHEVSHMLRDCENQLAHAVHDKQHSIVSKLSNSASHRDNDPQADKAAGRPMCPCRCMVPISNVWDWQENDHKCKHIQRRYGRCHGLIAREDANSGKLLVLPTEEGSEELNSMTTEDCTRELPRVLDRIRAEHDEMKTMIDIKCSLLSALAVFRDMRNEAGRTALHSAAFMDRDTSCKALLALGSDPAVRDRFSVSALQLMVANIPQSATTALNRFHMVDKSARMQYFYLLKLETTDPREPTIRDQHCRSLIRPAIDNANPKPRTILQEITLHERMSLVTHPVIAQLMDYKWQTFGKAYHLFETVKYVIYLLLWSAVGLRQPFQFCTGEAGTVTANCTSPERFAFRNDYSKSIVKADSPAGDFDVGGQQFLNGTYTGSGMEMGGEGVLWLIVEGIAFLWTLYYVYQEFAEKRLREKVARFHRTFALQSLDHISIGITDRCNLSANDYEHQVTQAVQEISSGGSQYFADSSNYLDILMLFCLTSSFVLQRVSQFVATEEMEYVAIAAAWLLALGLFVAWFNLLKFMRALESFGPLYVMIMKMGGDIKNFAVLYLTISIPMTIIFHMFYAGDAGVEDQFGNPGRSFMSAFHLLMVDFDTGGIQANGFETASILYLFWVFVSAIVMLNLFIAMMSATFQNAYDEKEAVWALERANIISRAEEYMSKSLLKMGYFKFHDQDINISNDAGDDSETLARYIAAFHAGGDNGSGGGGGGVSISKRESKKDIQQRDVELYAHKRHDGEDHEVNFPTDIGMKPPWYRNLGQMTPNFRNPTGTELETFLEEEYDDPDEEVPISNASVRAKMLAAVTRLEDQQETMVGKIDKMELWFKRAKTSRPSTTKKRTGGGRGARLPGSKPAIPPPGWGSASARMSSVNP